MCVAGQTGRTIPFFPDVSRLFSFFTQMRSERFGYTTGDRDPRLPRITRLRLRLECWTSAREKTMPVLRLILDPEGAAFDVDDAMLIGNCATQLASHLGYPTVDSSGMPVIYQLCLTASGSLLPNDRRFRDLPLTSGTRFTLVSPAAGAPTRPVHALGLPAATQPKPRPRGRWSRRAFLTTGTLGAFALSGLGTGLTVALAQRYLGRRRPAAAPLVSPTASSTTAPRIVSVTPALTFASHQQTVRVVAWSPDGQYLASGGDDGLLLLWGTDGSVRQRVANPAAVTALAWSPESERLVTGVANGKPRSISPRPSLPAIRLPLNLSRGRPMVKPSPPLRTVALCVCGPPKAGEKSTHSTRTLACLCALQPSPPPARGSRLAAMMV